VELDNLAAETAATMTTKHPDYAVLAARIAVSNLHKETKKVFTGITCIVNILLMRLKLCVYRINSSWSQSHTGIVVTLL